MVPSAFPAVAANVDGSFWFPTLGLLTVTELALFVLVIVK